MTKLEDTQLLEDRIDEVALELASDYPEIRYAKPLEQFWAIEQGYRGTLAANKDLHLLIDMLREKLGWTKLQVVEFWELWGKNNIVLTKMNGKQ